MKATATGMTCRMDVSRMLVALANIALSSDSVETYDTANHIPLVSVNVQ